MIPQNFEYSSPTGLKEALGLLADGAKPLAGGMSLIPMMKLRLAAPERLVDLRRISSLNYVREEGGELRIGAMTTHYEIESSPLLRSRCPLLAEAATHIGDVQVRNMGTIGGSIAHADPAADYPASLLALEARLTLASSSGERVISLEDFLVDTFTTALEPGEIILDIRIAAEDPATGVSYKKMVQPASGFAIVGVAARVRKTGGKLGLVRVGVTGMAPKAFRARSVEKLLEGRAGSEEDIQKAAEVVAEGMDANSDLHASAEFRKHLAVVYTARALRTAMTRAS
ncbi:MAG: FAD binding domain-containing protein [Bryobacteraceae bacterium]